MSLTEQEVKKIVEREIDKVLWCVLAFLLLLALVLGLRIVTLRSEVQVLEQKVAK